MNISNDQIFELLQLLVSRLNSMDIKISKLFDELYMKNMYDEDKMDYIEDCGQIEP